MQELLPLVERTVGTSLAVDPSLRAVCGISSGGIAAFNAAWHYPDEFGGVLSHCGSFTNIRGGHYCPYLVRPTDRKAIRVWMQSGVSVESPTFDGMSFGTVGQYEKLRGRADGEVDPLDPRNKQITDKSPQSFLPAGLSLPQWGQVMT